MFSVCLIGSSGGEDSQGSTHLPTPSDNREYRLSYLEQAVSTLQMERQQLIEEIAEMDRGRKRLRNRNHRGSNYSGSTDDPDDFNIV